MPSTLVVDAANVVGARPDGWWKDRAGAAARLHDALLHADLPHDEVVLVLAGTTTVILLMDAMEERIFLEQGELVVVPAGVWHRFEGSEQLKVMTITPQPTDHRLETPGT